MTSEAYHEPLELLSKETMDKHRAIISLMEELEAIDWYSQRVDATQDEELRAILQHNRNEEVEHAMMVLEWLRRRDPVFAEQIEGRIGRPGPIAVDAPEGEESPADGHLGIGSLRAPKGEKGER